MKIVEAEIFPVDLGLNIQLHSAHARYDVTHDIYIKVTADDGAAGYRATAPKFYITGESQATVVSVIRDYLMPAILGEDPFDIERIHARLDKAIRYNGAAKAAVDLAMT